MSKQAALLTLKSITLSHDSRAAFTDMRLGSSIRVFKAICIYHKQTEDCVEKGLMS